MSEYKSKNFNPNQIRIGKCGSRVRCNYFFKSVIGAGIAKLIYPAMGTSIGKKVAPNKIGHTGEE